MLRSPAFENLPPAQIVAATVAAGKAAGSAHFVARDVVPGAAGSDLHHGRGSHLWPSAHGRRRPDRRIRVIGGVVYLKASSAFLHQPFTKMTAADALRLAGHWILVRPGDARTQHSPEASRSRRRSATSPTGSPGP